MEFKKQFPLYERLQESEKVLYEYPDKVPVICEKDNRLQNCEIKKRKYLVSKDLTVGQFMYIIRKQIKVNNIFLALQIIDMYAAFFVGSKNQ